MQITEFCMHLIFFTVAPVFPSVTKSKKSQDSQTTNSNSKEIAEYMGIDNDGNSVSKAGKSFSVPCFLRKAFKEELGDEDGGNHKLIVIAVHAVLLESGFLEINSVTSSLKSNNNFDVQRNWHFTSFHYTLPNLITTGNIETIKIKFQNLGNYCKVYGSLVNGITHSVLLDEDKLVPFLQTLGDNNLEVFEFWRKTKDGLALPLLIDLCEKTGLQLPPCFVQLPTELKLKILDSVSGVEIAKVSCVCSELKYLASSEDLWKRKYIAQFGNYEGAGSERGFKERFVKAWEGRKRSESGGSSLNIMRRSCFNPFVSDYFGGDDREWRHIARLCMRGVGGLY